VGGREHDAGGRAPEEPSEREAETDERGSKCNAPWHFGTGC
jgi:hypothetical protein